MSSATANRQPAPPEVVTCGEAMLLLLAEPGVPLDHAVHFRRSVAGAEANVSLGLARLGHRVRWLSRVGEDPAGEAVLRALRGDGVDVGHVVRDPDAPTGLLLRDSHPRRGIDVQYYRADSAASRLAPAELTPEALAGARLVHLTGITPMLSASAAAATARLLDLAREAGATVCLDPNVRRKLGGAERWRETVGPLLRRADLVLAGADELELLTGRDAAAATDELLAAGAEAVVVKHPDHVATAHTADGSWRQPPFPVPLTDPVGAGDAFAAGYLSAWLRGLAPGRALAEGACVAALVVQTPTDTEGLPSAAARDRELAGFADGSDPVRR